MHWFGCLSCLSRDPKQNLQEWYRSVRGNFLGRILFFHAKALLIYLVSSQSTYLRVQGLQLGCDFLSYLSMFGILVEILS